MQFLKNFSLKACKRFYTLAYLSFKCGVVVELVTTLACHAGGRGFKSHPSRHFVFFLFLSFISLISYQTNIFASTQSKLITSNQNSPTEIVIIAPENPITSFLKVNSKNSQVAKFQNNSEFMGSDFQIIKIIFDGLKIPYRLQIVPWHSIELMLKNGEADLALGVQKTQESTQFADFLPIPMRTKNYFFYGRQKEAFSNSMTFEEAKAHNYKVGIGIGVLYPKIFWKHYPFEENILNNHLHEYQEGEKSIEKLKTKKIDLFVGDYYTTKVSIRKYRAEDLVFQYRNILFWKDFYCVFSKKSKHKNIEKIKAQVQRSLYKMQEKNQLKEIDVRWIDPHAAFSYRSIFEQ